MHDFPLPVRPEMGAEGFCHVAVHIPFDIGDLRLPEDLRDHVVDMVHHFLTGKVQDMLMP